VSLTIILSNMIQEELFPIKNYEGLYSITKSGKVFSHYTNRFLINNKSRTDKYYKISLCKNKIKSTKRIHRLVIETFKSNLDNYPEINHIDGNKFINDIDNLEWSNASKNADHAYLNNLRKSGFGQSKYVGVRKNRNGKRWRASIGINGKIKELGTFDNELDAALAYDNEAIKLNRRLNIQTTSVSNGVRYYH